MTSKKLYGRPISGLLTHQRPKTLCTCAIVTGHGQAKNSFLGSWLNEWPIKNGGREVLLLEDYPRIDLKRPNLRASTYHKMMYAYMLVPVKALHLKCIFELSSLMPQEERCLLLCEWMIGRPSLHLEFYESNHDNSPIATMSNLGNS